MSAMLVAASVTLHAGRVGVPPARPRSTERSVHCDRAAIDHQLYHGPQRVPGSGQTIGKPAPSAKLDSGHAIRLNRRRPDPVAAAE